MQFDEFVLRVREPLEVLDVEPAFEHHRGQVARFIQEPYRAELHPIDGAHVRLLISAHGEPIRTVELPLTEDAAWICWNGVVAIFEIASF